MNYSEQQLDGLRAYAKSMEDFVHTIIPILEEEENSVAYEQTNAMQDRSNKIYTGQVSSGFSELAYLGIWIKYELAMQNERDKDKKRGLWSIGIGIFFWFITASPSNDPIDEWITIGGTILFCIGVALLIWSKFNPCNEVKQNRNNDILRVNAIYQTSIENEPEKSNTVTFHVPPQS